MQGTIFNIQRFCLQDGPGIRTTVFMKGCPLRCAWCHNPESHDQAPEIFFDPTKCMGCGACAAACARGLHVLDNGRHDLTREGCLRCGACAEVCFAGALEVCGRTVSADEAMAEVLRDRDFYENTGGGMTLSGGEPLMQPDFAEALAKAAKENGVHVCVETSGACDEARILSLAKWVDIFLYDIKLIDDRLHRLYTGVSNRLILSNLRALDALGSDIILRCPIIPDVNLDFGHFDALAELARPLSHVREIQLEPYHPLGVQKSVRLGRSAAYDNPEFLERADLRPFAERLQTRVSVPVAIQ